VDACLSMITTDFRKVQPSFIPNSVTGRHSKEDQESFPVSPQVSHLEEMLLEMLNRRV